MRLVALAGPKGAGKSTGAKLLEADGFQIVSFAGPLKRMLAAGGFGSPQTLEEKEAIIPWLGVTWRHCAQTLGTEWGRQQIRQDLWVMLAMRQCCDPDGSYVFDDLRFENEAQVIRDAGGCVIHLLGRGLRNDSHASEKPLQQLKDDYIIENGADSVSLLQQRLREALYQMNVG